MKRVGMFIVIALITYVVAYPAFHHGESATTHLPRTVVVHNNNGGTCKAWGDPRYAQPLAQAACQHP